MLKTLCLFPGSYLVRAQEGELKYMAAFASPSAAMQWCLVMQEMSMQLPYPEELLLGSSGGSSCSSAHIRVQYDVSGRVVFRGFRLKMGLCEGIPKCILPDHVGRADYHGAFVNQAARYADAAAHGGQIVTDVALAGKILEVWQRASAAAAVAARGTGEGDGEGGEGSVATGDSSLLKDSRRAGDGISVGWNGLVGQVGGRGSRANSDIESWISASDACLSSGDQVLEEASTSSSSIEPSATVRHAGVSAAAAAGLTEEKHLSMKYPDTSQAVSAAIADDMQLVSPCASQQLPGVWVEAHCLGAFVFKGDPAPINMVAFYAKAHLSRTFPSHAPKGKGFRVQQQQGVLGAVLVELPISLCDRFIC